MTGCGLSFAVLTAALLVGSPEVDAQISVETHVITMSPSLWQKIAGNLPYGVQDLEASDVYPAAHEHFVQRFLPDQFLGKAKVELSADDVRRLLLLLDSDATARVMKLPTLTVADGQLGLHDATNVVALMTSLRMGREGLIMPQSACVKTGVICSVQPFADADTQSVSLKVKLTDTRLPRESYLWPELIEFTPRGRAAAQPRKFQAYCVQPDVRTLTVNRQVQVTPGKTALLYGGRIRGDWKSKFVVPEHVRLADLCPPIGAASDDPEEVVLLLVSPRVLTTTTPKEADVDSCRVTTEGRSGPSLFAGRDVLKALRTVQSKWTEEKIEKKLQTSVSLKFTDLPLKQIISDLEYTTGTAITLDMDALIAAGINVNTPVSLHVEDVPLMSALNLITKQVGIAHVLRDGELRITTAAEARGKPVTVTYPVADLVFNPLGAPVNDIQVDASRPVPIAHGGVPGSWSRVLPNKSREDALMQLITSTIDPKSWSALGGKGTIQYYPLGKSFVVTQTPDVQEQIADLLEALRRLNDVEAAVETRIVTVSEATWEKIVSEMKPDGKAPQQPVPGAADLSRLWHPSNGLPDGHSSGVLPAGTFTPDLDVPANNRIFDNKLQTAVLAATSKPAGNPKAVLTDKELLEFLRHAQQDKSANVMQLPRVTLISGQQGMLDLTDKQYYLAEKESVKVGDDIHIIHKLKTVKLGVSCSVQPVVSADRKSVRVELDFASNKLGPNMVIPVNADAAPDLDSTGAIRTISFQQKPDLVSVELKRSFTVGDGKTAVFCAGKVMTEVRRESGPPVLSKIPYVNRLFKNVGYGREAQVMLVLVTARIIVKEEEPSVHWEQLPPKPRPDPQPCEITPRHHLAPPTALPKPDERNAPRVGKVTSALAPPFAGTRVTRINAAWDPVVCFLPDVINGKEVPCLTGRLYLYSDPNANPVTVDGKVVVQLLDHGGPGGERRCLEQWNVDSDQLRRMLGKDLTGQGYTLCLPWTTYRGNVQGLSLSVAFTADGGPTIQAPLHWLTPQFPRP